MYSLLLWASLFAVISPTNPQREPVTFSDPLTYRIDVLQGNPFGVGMITFRLPPDAGNINSSLILQSGAVRLTEANNRVFYQVVGQQAAARFLQNVAGGNDEPTDKMHAIWFLFKGNQPLDLTLHGNGETRIQVEPDIARPNKFRRRMDQWWREYNRAALNQSEEADYPNLIECYLTTMLGIRLGFPITPEPKDRRDPLRKTFDLMFNVEQLRSDMIRDAMLGQVDLGPRTRVVPPSIFWEEAETLERDDRTPVEEIAHYVPDDCFYLRFGTWKNQLWLKRLLEEYGGDLGRMFSLRGYESRIDARFLDQLALESSELDEMFGASVIKDVAVIGMDTYFDDGPAVGVLLHAKGTNSLKRRIAGRRKNFASSRPQVTIEETEISGEVVSFLSTPNNLHRSFHVVKDDFHLITNSRRIAERFIEAAEGKRSLAQLQEFRFARTEMPLEQDHTIFVYLSTPFFQHLLHPTYQIELRRRNQSIADMQLLQMASLAAAAEGNNVENPGFLAQSGFLPNHFGEVEQFSRYELVNGVWTDSVRGARGFFLPIPDANVDAVTDFEYRWFTERASYFTENVSNLDPMFIGIKRFDHEGKLERVVVDARVAPFGKEKYGWLSKLLGPPINEEIIASPNDIIRFQMSMGQGFLNPQVEQYQLFAAVQDHLDPDLDLRPKSFLDAYQTFRETPGYIGAWPAPGMLDWMPQLGGTPDANGYTYSRLLKLWRLEWDDFALLSFDPARLEELKPHLSIQPAERPCHVRITVGDLAKSKLRRWANTLNYRRSWQTSLANVRMLNTLSSQFHLMPEQAIEVAEQMLDVKLVCSLGGEYALCETKAGRKVWCSTEWPNFLNPELPADYVAPVMGWFHGLQVEVTQGETQFAVHGYFDIERENDGGGLPSFKIFEGFSNLLGGSSEQKKDEEQDE